MTYNEINEMSRAIGSLESSVKILSNLYLAQEQSTQSGHRVIEAALNEVRDEAQRVEAVVQNLSREFAEIRPAIAQFKKARERAEAQRSLMAIQWGAIVTFATGLGYAANILIEYFKGRH